MAIEVVDPESVGVSSEYLSHIDDLVARHMSEDAYQGTVILVARHGKICYFRAFGNADDGVPMERLTRSSGSLPCPKFRALLRSCSYGIGV